MPKLIKNIHPPKDPKLRKKPRLKLRLVAKKIVKRRMANASRKANRNKG